MSQHESRAGDGGAPEGTLGADAQLPPHAGLSDAELTALLGRDTATAYPALRELRLRHGAFLTPYARLCTTDDAAARRLVSQALSLAAEEAARGVAAPGALRHHLLLLVHRAARAWAGDERAARLSAQFTPGEDEPPVLLGALRTLPVRTQAVLWYALVDGEPDDRVAVFLGASAGDVRAARDTCLGALRRAFLRTYLARHGEAQCQGYARLIENATSPENPRHSADLEQHLADCPCCRRAHTQLRSLAGAPRETLAQGLLPQVGAGYAGVRPEARGPAARAVRGRAAHRAPAPDSAAQPLRTRNASVNSSTPPPSWLPSRRVMLGSAALGIAVAPLLLFALTSGDPDEGHGRDDVALPPAPVPSATVTVTASPSASPSPTPSPTKSSKSPKKPAPSPTRKPPAPQPALQDGRFTQVVSAGNGRCLTVEDGDFRNDTDVVAEPCGPSDTQRWRLDANRGVIVSHADPDYCLDTRGDTYSGVGIWKCSSLDRGTRNLWFTVDASGTIRPVIQLDHAVTAHGSQVSLEPVSGAADQRWRAGLEPV
ncbi:RICIN domain-containing protein [Streptomyces indicus]|uniref:DNA-directed RNA polymerase specialized sigma subunit, sigma24 family n=1 Tax=Streptomyces indicus TaxID=417292 RepID=A0A1G9I1T4_9ACTN|nr:RICIN domain-containing protein [Streptomyces indicus]SDL19042.1 DNA-directed RNA polymerase specialized sigma subunit, sigma24 family [Streptomyces indicus]